MAAENSVGADFCHDWTFYYLNHVTRERIIQIPMNRMKIYDRISNDFIEILLHDFIEILLRYLTIYLKIMKQ